MAMAQGPLQRALSRLQGVEASGDGFRALCPAHDDHNPSLSITEGDDGRALVHCFAGCTPEAIAKAIGLTMRDLFADRATRRRKQREAEKKGAGIPPETPETLKPVEGLTLEEYSAAKKLPIEFLTESGLASVRYRGQSAIRISYSNEAGVESAVRFRHALDGPRRFTWRKGSKVLPYGLWRLSEARKAGRIVLDEGESDSQTFWFHGIPALGLPGATAWKEDWAAYLDGIPRIDVVIEPDEGGEATLKWLATSKIRDRVWLVRLDGAKDPSEIHVRQPERAKLLLQAALAEAIPWAEWVKQEAEAKRQAALERCGQLARDPRILDRFVETLRARGVIGETRAAKLIYLILTSRLLDKPVSGAIKGPSSAGKSFLVEQTLQFFPERAYYALSAMSERALAYSNEPLSHRTLVMMEAAGVQSDFANYLLRSLLSEGRLRYETVERTAEGLRSRTIEREGPTGLLVTTTAVRLHEENETRLFSIPVSDTPEQTRAVLHEIARRGERPPVDLNQWHALQEVLQGGEARVRIPYAEDLANLVAPVAVRLRRDFGALLALIRTHALLHQASRRREETGVIVATLDDYAAIYDLVRDLLAEGVDVTVSNTVRTTVLAVRELQGVHDRDEAPVTVTLVARALGVEKGTAHRRVRLAISEGYLRNLEERRGRPARLVLGEPLPDAVALLPSPDYLSEMWSGPEAVRALDELEERYLTQLRMRSGEGSKPDSVAAGPR